MIRGNIEMTMLGRTHKLETILKMRKPKNFSAEHLEYLKNRQIEINKKRHEMGEYKGLWWYDKKPNPNTGKRHRFNEETRKRMSEAHKKIFDDPIKGFKMQLAKMRMKPNYSELKLFNLLNELFPNQWKFTGDYSVWFGDKNPDFINVNGQKKLIELYGEMWHKPEEEQQRIDHFKQFGFSTLIVWAKELKNIDELKQKLINFC